MKTLLLGLSFILLAQISCSQNNTHNIDIDIQNLWANFREYQNRDLPQDAENTLLKIIELSTTHHRAYDFYTAWLNYEHVVTSKNWKLKEETNEKFKKAVDDFNDPLVTYLFLSNKNSNTDMTSFIKEKKDVLKTQENSSLYSGYIYYYPFSSLLEIYIKNDYEFVLWRELCNWNNDPFIQSELEDLTRNFYPNNALYEYFIAKNIPDINSKKNALRLIAEKYKNKAMSLFPSANLLIIKKDSLDNSKAPEIEFKKLYEECLALKKKTNSYNLSGGKFNSATDFQKIESSFAQHETYSKDLIKQLKYKNIYFVNDSIVFRNISEAKVNLFKINRDDYRYRVKIKDQKPIFTVIVKNNKNRFYVEDYEKIDFPPLDDGEYLLTASNGDVYCEHNISRYILSIAGRNNAKGYGIYVADAFSGKPYNLIDISIINNKTNKVVKSINNLNLKNNFTQLPKDIDDILKNNPSQSYSIIASCKKDGIKLLSPKIYIEKNSDNKNDDNKNEYNIFTDRGAYNPGDSIHFKVLGYKYAYSYKTKELTTEVLANKKYHVALFDSEENFIESLESTANDFGSATGSFVIPKGKRNGYFSIKIYDRLESRNNGFFLSMTSFRVDEFILPTFNVTFNPIDKLYVTGDSIEITGIVKSFTGENTSSIKLSYEVIEGRQNVVNKGDIIQDLNGNFSLNFITNKKNNRVYTIIVKGKDNTGETKEFNTFVMVNKYLDLDITLNNAVDALLSLDKQLSRNALNYPNSPTDAKVLDYDECSYKSDNAVLIEDNYIILKISALQEEQSVPVKITYSIVDEKNKEYDKGILDSDSTKKIDISKYPYGIYIIKANATVIRDGQTVINKSEGAKFLKFNPDCKTISTSIDYLFKIKERNIKNNNNIDILFASTNGPVYAVAEIMDDEKNVLYSKFIQLDGRKNSSNSICRLKIPYSTSFPDKIFFKLLYFKDFVAIKFDESITRKQTKYSLPLELTAFTNKALPNTEYTFTIKTDKDVECLANIYDKSLDIINSNIWHKITFSKDRYIFCPNYGMQPGYDYIRHNNSNVKAYGTMNSSERKRFMKSAFVGNEVPIAFATVNDCPVPLSYAKAYSDSFDAPEVTVRSVFSDLLTFQPFLKSDKDGIIELKFKTSDKLSTYVIALFAHNKSMANEVLRKELLVTMPVKLAVMEPKYLYNTDEYSLAVSLSNSLKQDISGNITVYAYNGKDYENSKPISSKSIRISVPADSSASAIFPMKIQELISAQKLSGDKKELGIKVVFVADKKIDNILYSDGLFVSVPVLDDSQTITESHSAVLHSGEDKNEMKKMLEKMFVNTSATNSKYNEISIIDMIKEAIPSKLNIESNNVITLTEALYVKLLSEKLGAKVESTYNTEKLMSLILKCRHNDGGFSWFADMESSPLITSIVLERFAKMEQSGVIDKMPDFAKDAVNYIDTYMFTSRPCKFYSYISMARYLYIRSFYCNVPFDKNLIKVTEHTSPELKKLYAEFMKNAKEYLLPDKSRGFNGQILAKATRSLTIKNFISSKDSKELLSAWDINLKSSNELQNSLNADIKSLLQYAVEHRDKCVYFPNAVFPLRGLLENEAYAHSVLCDLFNDYAKSDMPLKKEEMAKEASDVADGIRLWLMLQKETQKWDEQPEFVDAINSVLAGSNKIKETKVLSLTKTFNKPFSNIKAAGNGLTIERKYYIEKIVKGKEENKIDLVEIRPGDIVNKGEKIIAKYNIWNAENRSFIRVTAPREAGLRPVNQLSGYTGYIAKPLYLRNTIIVWANSNCYKEVKTDKTILYYESYPEEKTCITDEFYATQTGVFAAPVIEIESMYAPHYRANGKFEGKLTISE